MWKFKSALLSLLTIVVAWPQSPLAGRAADPQTLAVGEWSAAVVDKYGRAMRGRLMLCEMVVDARREAVLFVELQDATSSVGRSMRIFCDLGRSDFRPEYKGGLVCDLRDQGQQPVKPIPFAFSGAVPQSQWIVLPSQASIRLRASPFGMFRPQSILIAPHLGTVWEIQDGDTTEYSLTGTFTVEPSRAAIDELTLHDDHVWRGTIELPALKITGRKR